MNPSVLVLDERTTFLDPPGQRELAALLKSLPQGKIIVTNTTTPEDVALFKQCGIKYLMTTTPVLDGRSFGTNMMEAAFVAVSGKKRPLTRDEYTELLAKLKFEPQLQEIN